MLAPLQHRRERTGAPRGDGAAGGGFSAVALAESGRQAQSRYDRHRKGGVGGRQPKGAVSRTRVCWQPERQPKTAPREAKRDG